jgi:fructose-1,6-bisphosphatase/inositol monophosphatase family enzyme
MNLHILAAQVAKAFGDGQQTEDQSVVAVKDGNVRDVVTTQDLGLHSLTQAFLMSALPGTRLLSEEDSDLRWGLSTLSTGDVLVVDPLDGSNNFALNLPGYGYMACRLINGKPIESLVLVPDHDLYLLWSEQGIITSRAVQLGKVAPSAPSYYAYPPRLSESERALRSSLLELIDESSSGFYRYGSACVALLNVMLGKHQTFIGHRIRLWDGLAFLPLLASIGLNPQYSITGDSLTLVVGYKTDLVQVIATLFAEQTGTNLLAFESNEPLEFS